MLLVIVALGQPKLARATPNFPLGIQTYAKAPAQPSCGICHVGPQQRGTVVTPFGTNMRSRGLVAFDEGSLVKALNQMVADKVDSDGDGDTDVDALKAGRDPNVPEDGGVPSGGGASAAPLEPRYGCGAHVAPNAGGAGGGDFGGAGRVAGLAGAIALLAFGRRARRRA